MILSLLITQCIRIRPTPGYAGTVWAGIFTCPIRHLLSLSQLHQNSEGWQRLWYFMLSDE